MPSNAAVRGGVCYNVQTAVDDKHKLIVAHDATNAVADRDCLSPMAKAANAVLGAVDLHVIADQGYYNGPEINIVGVPRMIAVLA